MKIRATAYPIWNAFLPSADSQLSLREQLVRFFRKGVADGTLKSGIRLPASRVLAQELQLSRMTVTGVNGLEWVREGQLALFERDGAQLSLEANNDAVVLLLSGEPIDEPIVGHGPFVMNSEQEIHQAFADYQSGRFGRMSG